MEILNYLYEHPPVLLMAGDLSNLVGGVWLAVDLIAKEREMRRHSLYLRVLTRRHEFPIELDGRQIQSEEDVEIVFVRRKARAALYASVLLLLGFTLLAIGHWVEVLRG